MDLNDLKERLLRFIDDVAKYLGVELRVLVLIAFALGIFLGRILG
jgi:hypothetical protein